MVMDILVIGSGPTGLTVGAALARRGHRITSVDRDQGPDAGGGWRRRGVMQFAHAHNFRPQVSWLLQSEWPEAHELWRSLGPEPTDLGELGLSGDPVIVHSRRVTYERALRIAARDVPGLAQRVGHVDRLLEERGRVVGAVVDGTRREADLVVDASGRASRLSGSLDTLGGECGMAYVDRSYRLRPGSEPGPVSNAIGWFGAFDGYQVLVFPQERGCFSVVLIRPTADAALKQLRHQDAFDAACRAIPALATWTDPQRSRPESDVLVGGALRNVYRRQRMVPGLVAVGDAVSTTTPTAGRGVAMASMQIAALLALLDGGADPETVAEPFGAWCDEQIQPWVADHIANDDVAVERWQGAELDLSRPLTSMAILAAAEVDPRIYQHAGAFMSMIALPDSLAPAEPWARAVYESGWRPAFSEGPTRNELVAVVEGALAAAA
jgi:2-polyprenyl-6-methoxyphenol hydroxylase-like FAD-dependent oxidoreductase